MALPLPLHDAMTPIASLHVWSDLENCCSCEVDLHTHGCELVMRTGRQTIFGRWCDSLDDALATAEDLRSAYGPAAKQSAGLWLAGPRDTKTALQLFKF